MTLTTERVSLIAKLLLGVAAVRRQRRTSHYPVKQQGVTELLLFSTVSSAPDFDYGYRDVDDGESLAHREVVVGSGSSAATATFFTLPCQTAGSD